MQKIPETAVSRAGQKPVYKKMLFKYFVSIHARTSGVLCGQDFIYCGLIRSYSVFISGLRIDSRAKR